METLKTLSQIPVHVLDILVVNCLLIFESIYNNWKSLLTILGL